MKLKEIEIKNFRNLENLKLLLDEDFTFIIGENNLGKTNLLDLFEIILNKRKFDEEDFKNKNDQIEVIIKLLLRDIEIGVYNDLVDPNNSNEIKLKIVQKTTDDYIEIFHCETNEKITYSQLRKVNYIKYASIRKPSDELDFYKRKGAGKFLSFFVEKYYNNNSTMISESAFDELTCKLNNEFKRLKYFSDFNLRINYEKEIFNQVLSLLKITDENNIQIFGIGHGIQYAFIILFNLLQEITDIIIDSNKRDNHIFTNDKGERYCSIILGLDEPEIHLHPYMQRSLIKYINKILTNKDINFKELVKNLFGLDGLIGQCIVVTHSPNILIGEYKHILRLFHCVNGLKAISGQDIELNNQSMKHLNRQLPYVKEAFFSKCVIIVEGDTEIGALPEWFNICDIDLDDYGITILKADGKKSINPLKRLLNSFEIKTFTFADRDDGNDSDSYDFVTDAKDFEEDVANALYGKNQQNVEGIIKKILEEIGINEPTNSKDDFLCIIRKNKSINTGKIIGSNIPKDLIPESIMKLIDIISKGVVNINSHE